MSKEELLLFSLTSAAAFPDGITKQVINSDTIIEIISFLFMYNPFFLKNPPAIRDFFNDDLFDDLEQEVR